MTIHLCTACGRPALPGSSRCRRHPRTSRSGSGRAVHGDPRWTRISRRLVEAHVGEHGWVCPGDGDAHAPHPSHDLTADHRIPLAEGGDPFDRRNLRILCRSWNSTLGARLVNARRPA